MSVINVLGISHVGHLGATPGTGAGDIPVNELLRKYALGNRIAQLSPARDPFFTIVSKFRVEKTDDPEFKRLEERDTWHRRYAFAINGTTWNNVAVSANQITKTNWDSGTSAVLRLTTDYDVKGRFSVANKPVNGIFGTALGNPNFFFPNQQIKIPVSLINKSSTPNVVAKVGYVIGKVTAVNPSTAYTDVAISIMHKPQGWVLDTNDTVAIGIGKVGADYTDATAGDVLVPMRALNAFPTETTKRREDRILVIGSTYAEGSGLPNTTYSDKLNDTYGYTQIFKTDLTMTNTARATVLKHRPNEMLRRWAKTVLQHKRDITLAGLWSVKTKSDSNGTLLRTTEGIVDFIMNNGWVFNLDASSDYDTFLDQLSEFYHPEVAQEGTILVHVSTAVFNWFNRLNTGFFHNTFNGKNYFSANISFSGMKKFAGIEIMELATPHGTLRMTRDVNLDGTHVKMIAINYAHVYYRPLVGNGLNRDTTVYIGVKALEHTGDDKRTDLIMTEAGFDFELGETMAIWV